MPTPVDRRRRLARAVGYLHIAAAGFMTAWWPPPAIQQVTAQSFFGRAGYVWAALTLVGGLFAAWGSLWRKWPGEYIGLLAIIVVLWVYAVAAAVAGAQTRPRSFAGALILAGFGWVLLCRWIRVDYLRRDVEQIKHLADQQAEQARRLKEPGEGDGEQ